LAEGSGKPARSNPGKAPRPHPTGGNDHYPADREEAERLLTIERRLPILARANRMFLNQAVHGLAHRCGIRQFLDLGSGLPVTVNVHEVAQAAAPSCGVVYVENDPVAAVHAAALLAHGNMRVDSLRADLADPAAVLASPEVTQTLDLNRPVAAIFGMVLHFLCAPHAAKIVAGYTGALARGSYVVVSCRSGDKATGDRLASEYQPDRLCNHSPEQIAGFMDGLDVIPPGVVDAWSWAPGVQSKPPSRDGAHVLVAVASKGE
jgi:S-adenosyl methyltransferase